MLFINKNKEIKEMQKDFFERYDRMQREIAAMEKEVDELLRKNGIKIKK
ncbi:hypothetical protein [Segatella bryantii]|nr:hypothetical protein [Segatella bryantii]